jgi:hypothetical protein
VEKGRRIEQKFFISDFENFRKIYFPVDFLSLLHYIITLRYELTGGVSKLWAAR